MEEDKLKKNPNQINIELTEEVAEGVYANLAMIAHSNSEFVIDFIRLMPGTPKAKVKSRVVITPDHAVRLLNALKDNIQKYEKAFGPIKQTADMPKFPMNFGGTMGEA
jgi:phosphoglycerol transferase MdoB-like AlkP superfamily enzyme